MNEKREKILYGVLAFVIMVSSYPASLGIARLCASVFAEPNLYSWDFVYVSQSPNAHCYHHDLKLHLPDYHVPVVVTLHKSTD